MSDQTNLLAHINFVLLVPPALLSLIIWFVIKNRDSVWLVWLYRIRVAGAAFAVFRGILRLLSLDIFTHQPQGVPSAVPFFLTSLVIAGLAAREWGKKNGNALNAPGIEAPTSVGGFRPPESTSSAGKEKLVEALEHIAKLRRDGILTDAEFEAAKKKIING